MGISLRNFFTINPLNSAGVAAMGLQTPTLPLQGIDGAAEFIAPQRLRDVVGKLKVTQSQNIYDADFEYGTQPLRWEQFVSNVSGNASIIQIPSLGGVQMTIGGANSPGDVTIRQSRPYHRYQPGKTFYMASNVNFGGAATGQYQRVGIFDDSNGIFFMQYNPTASNPSGMYVVIRSDAGSPGTLPVDTVFSIESWNGSQTLIKAIDWTKVQMIWMEYAWYGAGALRWGVVINGEPWILHQVGSGNSSFTGAPQTQPWSRTGNLPVRYEQRDAGTGASATMVHYGVSVLIEGSIDKQRGFTYSYGNDAATQSRVITAAAIRYPVLSFRMRPVGTDQFDNTVSAVTAGTQTSLTIGATPALATMVGQYNNGQALLTFAATHNFPVTNPAQANQPASYINLGAFSVIGTAATGNWSINANTLTVNTIATGSFFNGQTLSFGAGGVGTAKVIAQLTSTAVATATTTATGTVGTSLLLLASNTNVIAGQLIAGVGIVAGTAINSVNGSYITISNPLTASLSATAVNMYSYGSAGTYSLATTSFTAGTGALTGTLAYTAATYLLQSIPTTTTAVISVAIPNAYSVSVSSVLPTTAYWSVNQWVGRIVYYAATLPTYSGATPTTATVGGITVTSAILTYVAPHNLNTNDQITITGATPTAYSGIWAAVVLSPTTIRINGLPTGTAALTVSGTSTAPYTARITSNTTNVLSFGDIVTGLPLANSASTNGVYLIGLTDRGQLLPQTLLLNSNQSCLVELISGTPTNEISLSGANFVGLNALGSYNSFAQQDLSSTSMAGGEIVYAFSTPPNGLQQVDLSSFFPVLTNIKGNVPDILTVAVTCSNGAGVTIQTNVVCQEAMA